jgi:hypothetical protein
MSILVPCPSCARHIATRETCCPFCTSALPADLESRAIPGTNRRLSRAAMFTFATTVTILGAVSSCDNGGDDSAYGCPATDESCNVGNLYGGPPFEPDATIRDSGSPDVSDTAIDGTTIFDDGGDVGDDANGDANEDAD